MNWSDKVAHDFRSRIIVDPDSPILASKANRDRYTMSTQPAYAGLPHLASRNSEDALTWNVFRSLQKALKLGIICEELGIGEPRGLLLWTLASEAGDRSSELQYTVGALIRQFDGILGGPITEPDVVIWGTKGVAAIECKLSEPHKPPSHLWEGSLDSVKKRLRTYLDVEPGLLREDVNDEQITEIYQLVRMAFYATQLAKSFSCVPVVASIGNDLNWQLKIRNLDKSAEDLWHLFEEVVAVPNLSKMKMSWQHIRQLVNGLPLKELSNYLNGHPCL